MESWDKTKGKFKKAVGEITGNERLKKEGDIDKAKGKVKEVVDRIAEMAKPKRRLRIKIYFPECA